MNLSRTGQQLVSQLRIESGRCRALLVLLVFALSGCGGLRLYSETRDKQGQAAAKAWSEVDLKAFFAAERDNDAKLLEQEIATSARRIAADRDVTIRDLARRPVNEFPGYYDDRLVKLIGGDTPIADRTALEKSVSEARNASREIVRWGDELDRDYSFLAQMDVPRFACDDLMQPDQGAVSAWAAEHPDDARKARVRLSAAKVNCEKVAASKKSYRDALKRLAGGELPKLVSELEKTEAEFAMDQTALRKHQGQYAAALAQYKAEVAKKDPGRSSKEQLAELAGKVESALKAIEALPDSFRDKFIAEERIKAINDLLADLKAGDAPGPDASKIEVAVLLLPQLADDVRAVAGAGKGTGVVPLLIKRDVEQARLNAAQLQLTTSEYRIALRSAAVESALAEAHYINRARAIFLGTPKATGLDNVNKPFHEAWSGLTTQQKFALLDSVGLYLDAVGRQRAFTERLQRTQYALSKKQASGLSEINAGMWSSLIGATVGQAAEFAASGFKASDFAGILSTLGIVWIGYGVNK